MVYLNQLIDWQNTACIRTKDIFHPISKIPWDNFCTSMWAKPWTNASISMLSMITIGYGNYTSEEAEIRDIMNEVVFLREVVHG